MSLRLNRVWLLVTSLLYASQAWTLGLGDIRLSSALNEPLRSEIELLAAAPEELDRLTVRLASQETFQRFNLDHPAYLANLEFYIQRSGRADGNAIRVTSTAPITEPFITFLVEASWSRGLILREYTLFLDPPTIRATEATTIVGGDILVVRGDTLWSISARARPDSRLSVNQTMLAIYEANPGAFDGNVNRLRSGFTLRIPSADDVFRISRDDASTEIRRQHEEWRRAGPLDMSELPPVVDDPFIGSVGTNPSLTLVPPDDEDDLAESGTGIEADMEQVVDNFDDAGFVDPVELRIADIETVLDDPAALVAIEDNDLASLRQELAVLRGKELSLEKLSPDELLSEALPPEDEIFVDAAVEPVEDETETKAHTARMSPPVVSQPAREEGIVNTILGYLDNIWVWIGSALIVTIAILLWFMRRAAGGNEEGMANILDSLDDDDQEKSLTESLQVLDCDDEDSIVMVETESSSDSDIAGLGDSMEKTVAEEPGPDSTDLLEMSSLHEAIEPEGTDTQESADETPAEGDESIEVSESFSTGAPSLDLEEARAMTAVGTKLDLARAYVDMGEPIGAKSILEEVLEEGDEAQKQQARQLIDLLPS